MTAASSESFAVAVGIDIGTSGVRAAALDARGGLVAFSSSPFAAPHELRSPPAWWEHVSSALRDLGTRCRLDLVRGLAVDGTSGTVLAVDGQGRPVGRPLLYNDPCPDADIVRAVDRAAPEDSPARGSGSGLARAIHLSREPGAARLLHQADWIAHRLGAGFVGDENNALKSGYDLDAEAWPDWIETAGLSRERLPDVVRAGRPVAAVGPAAIALGLPKDCILHAGTTDGCASFLATGAGAVGEAVTALGSTLVVKLACERPVRAPAYGVYSHRVGDLWLAGGASNSGGAVLKALFGEEELDALSARIDVDTQTGLDYYPLTKPGERFPIADPHLPPRLDPRPDDPVLFLQGILEGMISIEALAYRRLADHGGPKPVSVRTVGGGARNAVWTRMRQAALGVPFLAADSTEAAVGTARLVLSAGGAAR